MLHQRKQVAMKENNKTQKCTIWYESQWGIDM